MQRRVKEDGRLDNANWYYAPLYVKIFSGDAAMAWTPNQVTLLNVFNTKSEQTEYNGSFTNTTVRQSEADEDTSSFGLRYNARFGNTLCR